MKFLFRLLVFFGSFNLSAQITWTPLHLDPAGDGEGAGPDIDSIYYAVDVIQDSLWFKITTNGAMTDFGYYIFIDEDLVPTNGYECEEVWGGPGSGYSTPNTSIKMDQRFVFIARQGATEQSWTESWGGGGGTFSTAATFETPDATTIIIHTQMSDVDASSSEGNFNFIVAAGEPFFGQCSDYAPDGTFIEIISDAGFGELKKNGIAVFPNPVNDKTFVEFNGLESVERIIITNAAGTEINVPVTKTGNGYEFDFSGLPAQAIFIQIRKTNGSTVNARILKN